MDHSRMKKLLNWFGNSPLDSITPREIERRFQGDFRTSATWNRYRALLALTYRLAIRNNKAKDNPARLVPHKAEHNELTRILSVEEEKKVRSVILEKFPERLPEFELALNTVMRHCEQYCARAGWRLTHCYAIRLVLAKRVLTLRTFKPTPARRRLRVRFHLSPQLKLECTLGINLQVWYLCYR